MKSTDPIPPKLNKGIYRHSKSGNLYEVEGVALHSETGEFLVIYSPKYESSYKLFARPYTMFVELVELDGKKVPRFVPIDSPQPFLA